jgi:hypothetical protein
LGAVITFTAGTNFGYFALPLISGRERRRFRLLTMSFFVSRVPLKYFHYLLIGQFGIQKQHRIKDLQLRNSGSLSGGESWN